MTILEDNEILKYENGVTLSTPITLDTSLLVGELNNNLLINNLITDVKNAMKKDSVSYQTNVYAEHTAFKALVQKPNFHEFLLKIKASIKKFYPKDFEIREAWGNIYQEPKKDFANEHRHMEASAFCGIIYLTDGPGPGTYFKEYDLLIPEKKGRFVLFDSLLLHEVKPYDYQKERITISFNMWSVKPWGSYAGAYRVKENNNIKL
jgi:hypothetical protein